jgi:uncharacterized protein
MKEAMRSKDKLALETIRSLLAGIQYAEMSDDNKVSMADQELAVVKSELKKQQESLEFAEQADRQAMAAECKVRIAVIQRFLPSQLAAPELEKIVVNFQRENPSSSMGSVMQYLKSNFSGQYDGRLASEIVKKVLTA